jgi:hypothetical protein
MSRNSPVRHVNTGSSTFIFDLLRLMSLSAVFNRGNGINENRTAIQSTNWNFRII